MQSWRRRDCHVRRLAMPAVAQQPELSLPSSLPPIHAPSAPLARPPLPAPSAAPSPRPFRAHRGVVMRRWKTNIVDNRCELEIFILGTRCMHVHTQRAPVEPLLTTFLTTSVSTHVQKKSANQLYVHNEQRARVTITDELEADFRRFWRRHADAPLVGTPRPPGPHPSPSAPTPPPPHPTPPPPPPHPRPPPPDPTRHPLPPLTSGMVAVCAPGRNELLAGICMQTFGLYVVKLAVALALIGGVPRSDPSGMRIRGEIHLLLVGDPGPSRAALARPKSSPPS